MTTSAERKVCTTCYQFLPETPVKLTTPVRISHEFADFAGWDPDEKKSRVDVVKFVLGYVRNNGLQSIEDRRQIEFGRLRCRCFDDRLDHTAQLAHGLAEERVAFGVPR